MEPWQAFIFGAFMALVVSSIVYGSLVLDTQEEAYKKGLQDGKNRKSNGNEPEL